FPTANLRADPALLVPAFGIYAGAAGEHRAAVSIGVNPHYGGAERRIEAFLLDFEGDLYGRRLIVELWDRLREERAFAGEADVVGLASLHVSQPLEYDEPTARVSALVVDEAQRRRGIGEALVGELEAEARRRRCCLLYLTTAEQRTDAHAFYRRIGFEETG